MAISNLVGITNREGGSMFIKKPDFSLLAYVRIAFTSNYAVNSSRLQYFYPEDSNFGTKYF